MADKAMGKDMLTDVFNGLFKALFGSSQGEVWNPHWAKQLNF